MKHKHSELIKAWADGAQIEYRSSYTGEWIATNCPFWDSDFEYRIKSVEIPEGFITYGKFGPPYDNQLKGYEFLLSDGTIEFKKSGYGIPCGFIIAYRPIPYKVSRWQWVVRDKISGFYRVDPGLYTEEEVHAKFGNSSYYTLIGKAETTEVIFDA